MNACARVSQCQAGLLQLARASSVHSFLTLCRFPGCCPKSAVVEIYMETSHRLGTDTHEVSAPGALALP